MRQLCGFLSMAIVATCLTVNPLAAQDSHQPLAKSQGDGTPLVESRKGGIYRAPLLNNPRTLDPAYVEDIYGVTVVQQLFDGLVQYSPELFVIPALAENWQVEEGGKVYRFVMRNDAYFHNGRKITSHDAVFSLSRLFHVSPPPAIRPHLLKIYGAKEYLEKKSDVISGLVPVDDRTLVIRLEEPYAPFLIVLGMYQAKVVPEEEVGKAGDYFANHPVGSGPFRFISWEKNRKIVLERFSDYYDGGSYLDGIDFSIYPGGQLDEILGDFRKKLLDEMPVYGQVREKLSNDKDLQFIHRPSLSLLFYGFNCRSPRFEDPRIRKAFASVIDRQKLVYEVYSGQFEVARSIIPPGLPGYLPGNGAMTTIDPAPAANVDADIQKKIKEMGSVEIVSNSQSPFSQAELKYVQTSWARLGVDLSIKYLTDWGEFEQYLKSDALQIYRYAWFADIPDPDNFLQPLFASDSQTNFMRYRNNEVDKMLLQAVGTIDPIQRSQIYQEIQKKILGSQALVPLLHLSVDSVYQPWVRGIQVSPLGTHTISYRSVRVR